MLVEREATHRAIALSELVDVPILIVHVSGREAVEQIRWAHAHGLRIHAETCPQYLFLTADALGADGYQGAKCVCSPPPRDKANQQVIWDALADGLFTVFSSDHAPFGYEDPQGKKPGGKEVPFRYIPNGIPGIETRADRDQPGKDVRALSAQGHAGGRLGRRSRDLGRGPRDHGHEPHASPRGGLHALRGHALERLAGAHAIAGRGGVGRNRASRRARAGRVLEVRPALRPGRPLALMPTLKALRSGSSRVRGGFAATDDLDAWSAHQMSERNQPRARFVDREIPAALVPVGQHPALAAPAASSLRRYRSTSGVIGCMSILLLDGSIILVHAHINGLSHGMIAT
jgi:hypothetical protein